MAEARDLRETSARVEQLLAELGAEADPRTAERAAELVRLLMELYGAGLERVVEIVASSPEATPELAERLADDELVASLLILHGLHPLTTSERVQRALDTVRPYLGSHAGGVDFLGIDGDGVVHLRLEGSCDGCPSSTVTIKLAIERAIEEAAPEVAGIEVEGAVEPSPRAPHLIPVESLHRDRPAAGDAAGDAGAGSWSPLPDVRDLSQGELRGVEIAGARIVVCRAGDNLYAYRDACPSCGSAMAGGELVGELVGCPACDRRYNVRLAGRSMEGGVEYRDVHLDPLPLVVEGGETKVCLPVEVVS
ncbi:MAG: Rieske 2Fe-2S domain-containing protein [Streptosporangiales bacterium]|nr:Rieske 2Fe-2S domain-containing protein [Streptosporangiales bacterium]